MRHAAEFEHHGVAHEIARRLVHLRQILSRFLRDALAVFAGEQALVVERADLAFELARAPILGCRFIRIPLARSGIIQPLEMPVMRPAQIKTH